ncbi:hypothetical protein HZS_6620 [Henneguya salminicola]|nr:hypothetical protein HZS_6620 [Henneguya salminicola]
MMKQQDKPLRYLRHLHLFKKIMLFDRTKHWKNIYTPKSSTYRSPTQPLFHIRLWNPAEKTENRISRANNKGEGWYNAFAGLVGGNHLNIYILELSLAEVKIDTIPTQTTKQHNRPVYNQINRKLIKLMERRGTIPIITLLEKISYHLTY